MIATSWVWYHNGNRIIDFYYHNMHSTDAIKIPTILFLLNVVGVDLLRNLSPGISSLKMAVGK